MIRFAAGISSSAVGGQRRRSPWQNVREQQHRRRRDRGARV